jgi:hypothetical protein
LNVFCDIDHTLSAASWRDHMIGVSSWDEYHQESDKDEVIAATVELIRCLHSCGHVIIGITSRPARWRQLTLSWLFRHQVPMEDILMREGDDYRPAPELKMALARKYLGDDLTGMDLLIEDRDDVVAAFRAEGVTCIQVLGGRR